MHLGAGFLSEVFLVLMIFRQPSNVLSALKPGRQLKVPAHLGLPTRPAVLTAQRRERVGK